MLSFEVEGEKKYLKQIGIQDGGWSLQLLTSVEWWKGQAPQFKKILYGSLVGLFK